MRRAIALLLLLPALAVGKDSFRIEYFSIQGETAEALRADLTRVGPMVDSGMRGDAATDYNISWQASMTFEDGICRAEDVNVDLDVTMLLPRWEQPPNASPELIEAWDRVSAVLREHEDGHYRIAIAAAEEVRRQLGKRIQESSCKTLEARLNEIAGDVMREYRDKQADYDQRTDYGRKQTSGILEAPPVTSGR